MGLFDSLGSVVGGYFGGIPGAVGGTLASGQSIGSDKGPYQMDENGKPIYPTIDSLLQGQAGNPFLSQNLTYNPNYSQGYEGLKGIANAKPGEGTWEQYMLQNQALQQSGARDEGARQAASARALGFSDLARRGGISSGAASRLARGGQGDLMNFLQQNQRAGEQARLGIGTQAEQNRIGTLGKVADMETQGQQFNIKNILTQKALEDAAKLGKYSTEMQTYGANKTAEATANAGKGGPFGSWICTELHRIKPFTEEDWSVLTTLRKFFQKTFPDVAMFYFVDHGADLVEHMKANGINFEPFRNVVSKVIILGGTGQFHKAIKLYWNFTKVLCDIYAPELNAPEYDDSKDGFDKIMSKEFEMRAANGHD